MFVLTLAASRGGVIRSTCRSAVLWLAASLTARAQSIHFDCAYQVNGTFPCCGAWATSLQDYGAKGARQSCVVVTSALWAAPRLVLQHGGNSTQI